MKTGWDANYGTPKYENFDDATGKYYFPGFLPETAEWLLNERDIVGIGIDTASGDIGTSADYKAHYHILGAGHYILENLTLTEVPEGPDNVFIAAPVYIKDAPETSVRVMAIVGYSPSTYLLTACSALIATMLAF